MGREVDPRRTRKALRQLARLKSAAQDAEAPASFSTWEGEFLESLEQRLETFGSAFADYGKGAPEEALSHLQQQKLKELAKKAQTARREARAGGAGAEPDAETAPRGAQGRAGFGRAKPKRRPAPTDGGD